MENNFKYFLNGPKLKAVREALRPEVTQDNVAKKLGISRQTYNGWEKQQELSVDQSQFDVLTKILKTTQKDLEYVPRATKSHDIVNDTEEVYRTVVHGNTEYLLIPKSILKDEYRIVPIEKLRNEEKEIEKDKESNAANAKDHDTALQALALTVKVLSDQLSYLQSPKTKHGK